MRAAYECFKTGSDPQAIVQARRWLGGSEVAQAAARAAGAILKSGLVQHGRQQLGSRVGGWWLVNAHASSLQLS